MNTQSHVRRLILKFLYIPNFGPDNLINYTLGHPIFYEAVFISFGNVGPIFRLFWVKMSKDPTESATLLGHFVVCRIKVQLLLAYKEASMCQDIFSSVSLLLTSLHALFLLYFFSFTKDGNGEVRTLDLRV